MKKIVCMLMALCLMILPVAGMAADFENYSVYESADGGFAFAYPGDWMLLSKENIDEIWTQLEDLGDEEFQALMESVRPQIEQLGMIILVDATMESNISVICQDAGMELTPDMLMASAASIQQQLASTVEGVQFPEEPSLVEMEQGQAMLVPYLYSMVGMDMLGIQAYVGAGANLYTFTVTTAPNNEDAVSVLGFVLGSARLN